jgi:hypothetical protein
MLVRMISAGQVFFYGSVGHLRPRAHFNTDAAFGAVVIYCWYGMLYQPYSSYRAGSHAHAAATAGFAFNNGYDIVHILSIILSFIDLPFIAASKF